MVSEINDKEFSEKIKGKCVVDFFASWCSPCKMLAPVYEEVSGEMTDVKFYKLNIDDNVEIAGKYGVTHVPTLILFKDGMPVNKKTGYMDKAELTKFLNV